MRISKDVYGVNYTNFTHHIGTDLRSINTWGRSCTSVLLFFIFLLKFNINKKIWFDKQNL